MRQRLWPVPFLSPSISIDYGVMEKAKNVCTIPGRFEWDDLGTWQSLYRYQEQHPEPVVHTSQCKGALSSTIAPIRWYTKG